MNQHQIVSGFTPTTAINTQLSPRQPPFVSQGKQPLQTQTSQQQQQQQQWSQAQTQANARLSLQQQQNPMLNAQLSVKNIINV